MYKLAEFGIIAAQARIPLIYRGTIYPEFQGFEECALDTRTRAASSILNRH